MLFLRCSIVFELPAGLEAWLRAEAEHLEVPPGYAEEWIRQTAQAELALTLPPGELQQSRASMERLAQTLKERARNDLPIPDGAPPASPDPADRGQIIGPAPDLTPAQRVEELRRLIKGLTPAPNVPPLETLTRESIYGGSC